MTESSALQSLPIDIRTPQVRHHQNPSEKLRLYTIPNRLQKLHSQILATYVVLRSTLRASFLNMYAQTGQLSRKYKPSLINEFTCYTTGLIFRSTCDISKSN